MKKQIPLDKSIEYWKKHENKLKKLFGESWFKSVWPKLKRA